MTDTDLPFTVLVVAKAPVAGLAKTRLCPPLSAKGAADVAAGALLDTLEVAAHAVGGRRERVTVALTGSLPDAARSDELSKALQGCCLIQQRGAHFGQRLANAHLDAAEVCRGAAVVQIGMDTPQADPAHLARAAATINGDPARGVIGDAHDGGWWLLALADPSAAQCLTDVPMSRPDTGARTRSALKAAGITLSDTAPLLDVDVWDDAAAVAAAHPTTHFARAVRQQSQQIQQVAAVGTST